MRTFLVLVMVAAALGLSGCRKRVRTANTPEGRKCQRECMLVYQSCMSGRGGGAYACRGHENECLKTCPMAGDSAPASYQPQPTSQQSLPSDPL